MSPVWLYSQFLFLCTDPLPSRFKFVLSSDKTRGEENTDWLTELNFARLGVRFVAFQGSNSIIIIIIIIAANQMTTTMKQRRRRRWPGELRWGVFHNDNEMASQRKEPFCQRIIVKSVPSTDRRSCRVTSNPSGKGTIWFNKIGGGPRMYK